MNNQNSSQAFELTAQQKHLWPEQGYLHIQWHISAPIGKTAIEQAVQTLVQTHGSLRHSYTEQAGLIYPLQTVIDMEELDNADQGFCAQLETTPNGHQLTVVLSPLSADLYSAGLLHQQLSQLLESTHVAEPFIEQPQADYLQFSQWQAECLAPQSNESADSHDCDEHQEQQAAIALTKSAEQCQSKTMLGTTGFYEAPQCANSKITKQHLSINLPQGEQIHALAEQLTISVEALLVTTSVITQLTQANQYNPCDSLQIDVSLPCRPFEELTTITGRLSKNARLSIDHYHNSLSNDSLSHDSSNQDKLSQIATRVDNLLNQHQHLAEYLPGCDSSGQFLQSYLALNEKPQAVKNPKISLNKISDVNPCAVAFTLIDNGTRIKASLDIQTTPEAIEQDALAWQIWLARYEAVLAQLLLDTNQNIAQLKTTLGQTLSYAISHTQAEQTFISQIQGPQTDYSQRLTIIGAIEHFALLTPEQTAVVYQDQSLTYQALYQRVLCLAANIDAKCKGSDNQTVAINLPRGINYLVAMLACLAANKAFVPLATFEHKSFENKSFNHTSVNQGAKSDQTSPRLQQLLAKIKPALVIDNSLLFNTSVSEPHHSSSSAVGTNTSDTFTPKTQPATKSLAYIIYTSGTTGEPKGVQISHGNLHNYAHSLCDHLQLRHRPNSPLKAACVSTLTADLGYSTLFPTWLSGGSVHLLPMSHAVDETLYHEYLSKHQIDIVKMVPSHLQTLIDNTLNLQQAKPQRKEKPPLEEKALAENNIKQLLPQKHLILGGETLTLKLLTQLLAAKHCDIHNHYGPSEATVGCFAINYSATSKTNSKQLPTLKHISNSAPIGQPLTNVQFAVVDEKRQCVPLFAQGELIIGGAGISQGYRASEGEQTNDNDNDNAKFIDFNFTGDANAKPVRAYRSGDKVKLLPNGYVEFLGRLDGQVKLRGYRVELPAIEQQILLVDGITGVCVKLHQPQSLQPRLVCWYSANSSSVNSNQTLSNKNSQQFEQTLIDHLAANLPDYMCPSQWIAVKQMPLTANGKINRKALPDPCQMLAEQRNFCPPTTPTEVKLAALWQTLLGLNQVSTNDDFFALGGNSLIATQVVANLRQQTGLKINLADLFDHPTLAAQSAFVDSIADSIADSLTDSVDGTEQQKQAKMAATTTTIKKVPLTGKHPLSFAQQRLWFLDQLNPNSGFYNVPAQIRFTSKNDNIVDRIERALNELLQHHHALRLRFCLNEQNQPQQYLSDEPLVIERINGFNTKNTDISALASRGFNLIEQPLLRAHWITDQNTLLIVLHHIISDAWSTDLLLKHFAIAYNGAALSDSNLNELNYNFIDHCHWQHHAQATKLINLQLSFWQQQLHGAEQYVKVPNSHVRPEYQTYNGARLSSTLNADALAALDALCQQHQVSRFMLFACGFNLLLNHYSGQQDISIAIPVAGRNHAGFEHTVGLFLNTLVLRSQLDKTFTPGALLTQIKRTSLAMFDNQDLPFDRLIRELSSNTNNHLPTIKRATSYTPFNQVCLNVLNTPLGKELAIEGAELIGADIHTAKYDFEWILSQKPSAQTSGTTAKQLEILVEYNRDLFSPQIINQMLGDYVQILTNLPKRLNAPISQLLAADATALTPTQLELATWRQQNLERCITINPMVTHATSNATSSNSTKACDQTTSLKDANLENADTATLIASCALAVSTFSQQDDPFVINWHSEQQTHSIVIDLACPTQQGAKQQGLDLVQWITTIDQQLALDKLIKLACANASSGTNISSSLNIGRPSTNSSANGSANMDILYDGKQLVATHQKFNQLIVLTEWIYQQLNSQSHRPPVQYFEQLQWVTPQEQQALIRWGQGDSFATNERTKSQSLIGQNLISQINAQAAATPKAIAITQGTEQLSYAELQQHSNQLAHCLLGKGIGNTTDNNHIVAIEGNGINWIIMMLAVIKTGAAYLPLEYSPLDYLPSNNSPLDNLKPGSQQSPAAGLPQKRKATIIEDAQVELVLNDQHPWFKSASNYPSHDLQPNITNDTPLYVLYTSGSTGEPKGAVVTHASEQNLVSWYQKQYQINAQDKLLIASSTSFDLTQKNLFTALCVGVSLHFPDMERFDADCVVNTLHQQQATLLNCAPSAFYSLLTACNESDRNTHKLNSLRYLLLGGEPIDLARILPWLNQTQSKSQCQLVNMYGPTECTDIAAAYTYAPAQEHDSSTHQSIQLPIGRPSGGVQLYVLDSQQKLLPQGMVGELYIGGAGVGLGYLNRPEKTAASFMANPYQSAESHDNSRLYKSDDLVYIDHNQQLIFVGRNDHQIKHRGFRIELNAISTCLQQHQKVLSAATFVLDNQLIACYQLTTAASTDELEPKQEQELNAALKTHLAEHLPHYMVPDQCKAISQMPLSKNGKLDLIALTKHYQQLAQQQFNLNSDPQTVALSDQRQIWLTQLWQQLLAENNIKHPSIGKTSDFFVSGGHSLIATQLASRIRKETGLDLPLTLLFDHSRLDNMASAIDKLAATSKPQGLRALHKADSTTKQHPLSSAQQRLWFIQQLNPNDTSYNMSSYLTLDGDVNITALAAALLALVERHMSLRSCFVRTPIDSITVDSNTQAVHQRLMPTPESVLKCHYLHDKPDESHSTEIEQLMDIATQTANQPFNLSKDLMLRANLYNDKLLQLTIHHIASDGWSMGIIIKELAALYQHFAIGENSMPENSINQTQENDGQKNDSPLPLAPLPIQYVDYAHWQQQQLSGERITELNRFWQQNLANAPTLMKLPLDNPRPAVASSDGARVDCTIDQSLFKPLNTLASQNGATTFMAMLAVFDVLMHQWTGQDDIVVGTDLANREQAELENLIGFFVNLLPTRLDLSGNPSFSQVLNRAKNQCLGVYQHQDMPFDKLVELTNPERAQSHHPLVQVLLVLQNAPKPELTLGAAPVNSQTNGTNTHASNPLSITPIEPANHSTRFELGLFIEPTAQGLTGHWSYNTSVFNHDTIVKLNQQFIELISQICINPDAPISRCKPKASNSEKSRRRLAGLRSTHSTVKKSTPANSNNRSLNHG